MSQSVSRLEAMVFGSGRFPHGQSRSHKDDRDTSGHLRTRSRYPCSLTIDYEEQEQTNKVSGGTPVYTPPPSPQLIVCISGPHQTDYAEG